MAPILVGPQGAGKSRGILAMAPAPAFSTTMSFAEDEKERARKMRGVMIVELAELNGLKTREREEILAWVTRSTEHWTPKFVEMSRTFNRRFIMFGTTNLSDILDDPTGERRWLPLTIGAAAGFTQVDTDGIAAARDQLWAEGCARFLASGIAWEAAQRLARSVHHLFKADDLWAPAVRRWLRQADLSGARHGDFEALTLLEVAEGALNIAAKALKPAEERRISKILGALGYTRGVDARQDRVWLRPDFI